MKMIDEKGRLFGKINVIDFLAIMFLLFFLPVFYFGYRLISWRPGINEVVKREKFKEYEMPCRIVNITPEILKTISVGDKEIGEDGKTIGEITWLGEPEPFKQLINLGGGNQQLIADPVRKELPAIFKIKAELINNDLFYKRVPVCVNEEIDFKTDNYTVIILPVSKFFLKEETVQGPKRFVEMEVSCNFIKIEPEILKLISSGDKELDSNGETIGEIVWVGEARSHQYLIEIGDNKKEVIKDNAFKDLPVRLKIKAEEKDGKFYYKHFFVNGEVVFKTERYAVTGRLTGLNKEKWAKIKVRFSGMTPELNALVKAGHIEKDKTGRIIARMSAVINSMPQEIKMIDPQEKRFIFLSDPYMNQMVVLMELLCTEEDDGLYFKRFPIKIGGGISFSSDLYVLSGTIIGIDSK